MGHKLEDTIRTDKGSGSRHELRAQANPMVKGMVRIGRQLLKTGRSLINLFYESWRRLCAWFNTQRKVLQPVHLQQRQDIFPKGEATIDWVIPGLLAVGGLPGAHDLNTLTDSKIRVILSLCAPTEGQLPTQIEDKVYCMRLVLPDSHYSYPLSVEKLSQAVDLVSRCTNRNLPIYVHCLAGIERSPTVCIAYLCKIQGLELWEAIAFVKQVHPSSAPNPSHIDTIRQFLASDRDSL
jgi:atypical dual specificity phosphatase